MPYYPVNDGYFVQSGDTVIKGTADAPYVVSYYNWDGYSGIKVGSQLTAYEKAYSTFVHENYTYVDAETLAFMQGIIASENFNASNANIINQVAKYIQNAATYNLEYDTAVDEASNPIIAFLTTHPEGVCRHYAQAATLLYRSLGIPARYTEGFVADVKANVATEVTAGQAHAWVEVYVEQIGWLRVEVTGGSGGGSNDNDDQKIIKLNVNGEFFRCL